MEAPLEVQKDPLSTGWFAIVTLTLRYLSLPVRTLLRFLLWILSIVLSPILLFVRSIIAIVLLPLRWLAKFETFFIYLSVAAVVGLVTGTLLHLSSSLLVSVLNLAPASEAEDKGRTAASVRAAREQKILENAWKSSSSKVSSGNRTGSDSLEEQYSQWLGNDAGKRQKKGVAGQTILEEDDDSLDGF